MEKLFTIFALVLLSSVASAAGNDFQKDSAYRGQNSSPFNSRQQMALISPYAYRLREILLRCVVEDIEVKNRTQIENGPKVRRECSKIIQTRWDENAFSDMARVNLGGMWIFAMTFDAHDSDDGDAFDIAVYDDKGNRIALATGIYRTDNALYGLGALVGIKHFPIHVRHGQNH